MDQQSTTASPANGTSTAQDLFVLTDEQILEIEPEAAESATVGQPFLAVQPRTVEAANAKPSAAPAGDAIPEGASQLMRPNAQPGMAVPQEPPAWLAAQMKDPWSGQEAQELWNGVQQAKSEAAAYRAAFSTPEDARALKELYPGGVNEARAAAERARTLDDVDRAYFGATGDSLEQISAARTQLAQTMLRENPAAFREMVFAGLRALEAVGNHSGTVPVGATLGSPAANGGNASAGGASPSPASPSVVGARHASSVLEARPAPLPGTAATSEAHVAAYAAFEKAANEDLERSVGATVDRTLEQALPRLSRSADASVAGARHAASALEARPAPLQARLRQAVRQDVEAALKSDRQLGEQIAQILSARRFDNETRAQVVRLIGERAQQLVPGAAKRVLNEWTQTTLAAHRGQSQRADAASARREVGSVSGEPPRGVPANPRATPARAPLSGAAKYPPGRVDYRKLSDEQILDL